MQEQVQRGNGSSSEAEIDEFEEMVRASKLFLFIALIGCQKMRSALSRGVELLSEPELGSVQTQEQTEENPGKSSSDNKEVIGGVPKNAAQLKPVLDKLKRKVIIVTI